MDSNAPAKATASSSDKAAGISGSDDGSREDPRRHQHWDVRNFFSNYGYLIGGNALNALFSFLNIWLATHALGASGYGSVAALMAAGQAVLMIAVNSARTIEFSTTLFRADRARLRLALARESAPLA